MIIGLDFDNTIVSYDALFHKVAKEKGLITASVPVNKVAVRDYLRTKGQEASWTEIQGYVYGARLDEATAYPGAVNFLRWAKNAGHMVKIISHKTLFPIAGPEYNLHAAARNWISRYLKDEIGALIDQREAFFEYKKTDKIKRIEAENCDIFLDDLPEILSSENFPARTKRVLFDPEKNHISQSSSLFMVANNWSDFQRYVMS